MLAVVRCDGLKQRGCRDAQRSGCPASSRRDVPAIIEHLMNLTDLGSGSGEAEGSLGESPATCQLVPTAYNAQQAKVIRFGSDDRHLQVAIAKNVDASKHSEGDYVCMGTLIIPVEFVKIRGERDGGKEIGLIHQVLVFGATVRTWQLCNCARAILQTGDCKTPTLGLSSLRAFSVDVL